MCMMSKLYLFNKIQISFRRLSSTLFEFNNQLKRLNANKQYEKVIDLFENHVKENIPTDIAINQTLKACIESGDLKRGEQIHQRLSSLSKQNHFIQTNLIRLFMKSGDLNKAKEIFEQSQNKTIVMYNTMLNGLANNNHCKQTIDLFKKMSIPANEYTYTILFKTCSQLNDQESIQFGNELLKNLPNQYRNHTIINNSALHMLMEHGNVLLAEKLFSQMSKDTTTYGVMMSGYVKQKQIQNAIDLFFQIDKPNEINHIVFFNACGQAGDSKTLKIGKQIFDRLSNKSNEKIRLAALQMFIKCSDINNAEKLFSKLHRNQITFELMMRMFNKQSQPKQTLDLFKQMKNENIQPNEQIFSFVLNAFFQLKDFLKAQQFFDKIPNKSSMIYDVMLNGLTNHNRAQQAFELFQQMTCLPTEHTYSILFKICSQIHNHQSIEYAKKILEQIPKKYENNTIILNSALHMFMQYGEVLLAEKIFQQMNKDTISYGVMMSGYLKNNRPEEVIDLFFQFDNQIDEINLLVFFNACAQLGNEKGLKLGEQIYSQQITNEKILHAVLNMFVKCSDIDNAEKLFKRLDKNAISYGCMMTMYNNKNEGDKTLALYEEMKRDKIETDELIWILLINALAELSDLLTCELIISELPEKFHNHIQIENALINMWGKSSSVDKAKNIFDRISKPNNISFSAMINAYGLNGLGREAVQLYQQIPIETIDDIINLCVLNACSHSSLIGEARKIFENIPSDKRTTRIYSTMVDCFSRSNLIIEAEELITEYEQRHPPCYSMYMSILSAARNQRNSLLAQKIYDRIQPYLKDEKNYAISATVLLANTYALAGDLAKASMIRMQMNQSGWKKLAGLSWTVVNGKIVKFHAHDRSHPQSKEIYAELERLTNELKQHGYQCDASWISRPLMNDETEESMLSGHSERLAIAFNLIQHPIPTRIQVMNNLRMCGDCHTFTKLVAQVRQCVIVVRDANRIHHFYPDGHCSCGDFF